MKSMKSMKPSLPTEAASFEIWRAEIYLIEDVDYNLCVRLFCHGSNDEEFQTCLVTGQHSNDLREILTMGSGLGYLAAHETGNLVEIQSPNGLIKEIVKISDVLEKLH